MGLQQRWNNGQHDPKPLIHLYNRRYLHGETYRYPVPGVTLKSGPAISRYKVITMASLIQRSRVPEEQIWHLTGMAMAHPIANRETSGFVPIQRQGNMLPLLSLVECISPMFIQLTTPHRLIPRYISKCPLDLLISQSMA